MIVQHSILFLPSYAESTGLTEANPARACPIAHIIAAFLQSNMPFGRCEHMDNENRTHLHSVMDLFEFMAQNLACLEKQILVR